MSPDLFEADMGARLMNIEFDAFVIVVIVFFRIVKDTRAFRVITHSPQTMMPGIYQFSSNIIKDVSSQ